MRDVLYPLVVALLVTCPLAGCGARDNADTDSDSDTATVDSTGPATSSDTVPPQARPGHFAAHAPDAGAINGEWPARAGECGDPPSLQLLVDGDSIGVLVVVALPDSGSRERDYPVSAGMPGPPEPGTVRVSVQRIQYTGIPYRAVGGAVTLERFSRRVSGQLDVQLRDVFTEKDTRYLGTFNDIPVGPWDSDLCVLSLPDSAAADSGR